MAAVLAEGTTVIENAAEEPEIVDTVNFLNKMGARIKGAGTDTIRIEGVKRLRGAEHFVIPDRIETGTFMIAAAITRGNVLIQNAVPDHVKSVTAKLTECGVSIKAAGDALIVDARNGALKSTDIKTLPYPGFPTDIQSQFMALLTTTRGTGMVIENVFENRYMHVDELNRMGANIKIEGRVAIVEGDRCLHGAEVFATDLRAGAALVLAALAASGTTQVYEIHHIERGYSSFTEKMNGLGADMTRAEE
jgi:UDP-N-acetylglucosamine 1-carboxyvinyltransferase